MFKAEDIQQARFISAGHVGPDPRWRMSAHHHTIHELIGVVGGAMTVQSGGVRTVVVAGEVVWYPAGVVHAEHSDPVHPLESRFLTFACPPMAARALVKSSDERGRIRQITAWLRNDTDASSSAVQAERDALLQAALAEFLRGVGAEDQPLVSRTRAHVRDHLGDALTLEELAAVNGLSKFHFLRLYKEATGRTPMQDVRIMRASAAREMILGTNLPFKDIAPRAGLGDEYAMSRVFRQVFGMPPGRYRRTRPVRVRP
jgi:AraC-like DNA-binding protein